MKDHDNYAQSSRRKFIGQIGSGVAALALTPSFPSIIQNLKLPDSRIAGVQIGVITYSFRSMATDLESIIRYCNECGINALELMGNTAEAFAGAPFASVDPVIRGNRQQLEPEEQKLRNNAMAEWRSKVDMKKFEQMKKMLRDNGITVYAYKPSALGANNSEAEVHYAMKAAKALGATHVTLEMPKVRAQTGRLSSVGGKYKINVAYHGHEQQTPDFWDDAIKESKYNMLNCDLGHYVAAGFDPVQLIRDKSKRIASTHIKDRQKKENGKGNLPWGTGDTPIAEILQTMKTGRYNFPATIELEYQIPEGSDAVKEVGKCMEFCRKALRA